MPFFAISAAISGRIESPCSIESTPAATAMRSPLSERACAATLTPWAWASETTASISSFVQLGGEST